MNEDQFENLMSNYTDSLGSCSRRPESTAKPSRWRVRFALSATVAMVGVASVAFWPHDSVAATLRRLKGAITNAKSIEAQFWMQSQDGTWQQLGRMYERNGMIRGDYHPGTPTEFRNVTRDGLSLMDYQALDHATIEPYNPENDLIGNLPGSTALEYVEQAIDMGSAGQPRKISIKNSSAINGAQTYVVVLDRNTDKYHAEIIVDRQTDLPISAEISVQGGKRLLRYRTSYAFNRALPESLFALSAAKKVVDVRAAQSELAAKWLNPIEKVKGVSVRDATVTADGTVWLTVSSPEFNTNTDPIGEPELLPTKIQTKDGGEYARLKDIVPAALLGGVKKFVIGNDLVYMVAFVPLNPKAPLPIQTAVQFANRVPSINGFVRLSKTQMTEEPVGPPITLQLNCDLAGLPSYFPALDLDYFGFQVPMSIWDARAEQLAVLGRDQEAALAYEQASDAWQRFHPKHGANAMRSASICFGLAGMKAEAQRDLNRAHQLLKP